MSEGKVIIMFNNTQKNTSVDIEVPLDITATELVVALNSAYKLNIDITDIKKCYLKSENPIALLRGDKTLKEFGIRNGSVIYYT